MNDADIIVVIMEFRGHLDKKQLEFVADVAGKMADGAVLTWNQQQYLQSVYDAVVAKAYGLEPMATDREFAARRAISRARRRRGE